MTALPLQSHEILAYARNLIGMTRFRQLYGGSESTIYRHTRDRETIYEDPPRSNHIDSLRAIIRELLLHGRKELAIHLVDLLAAEVPGLHLIEREEVTPDHATIEDECLDDYPAITRFHGAIRDGEAPEVIRYLWKEASHELEETFSKALEMAFREPK
jgi:hypothetical protein